LRYNENQNKFLTFMVVPFLQNPEKCFSCLAQNQEMPDHSISELWNFSLLEICSTKNKWIVNNRIKIEGKSREMNLISCHFLTILSGKILLLTLIPGIKILRDSSACAKSSDGTPVTKDYGCIKRLLSITTEKTAKKNWWIK